MMLLGAMGVLCTYGTPSARMGVRLLSHGNTKERGNDEIYNSPPLQVDVNFYHGDNTC